MVIFLNCPNLFISNGLHHSYIHLCWTCCLSSM